MAEARCGTAAAAPVPSLASSNQINRRSTCHPRLPTQPRAIHREHGAPRCPAPAGAAVGTGVGTGGRVCMSLLWRSHAGAPGRTRFGTGASQAADLGGAAHDQSSQNNSPSTPGSAGQSPPETAARKCGSCKRGGGHQLCYHHRWVREGQAESRQGEGGGRGDRQKRQGVGGGGVDWLCRTEDTRQSLCLLKGLRKAAGGGGRSLREELIAAHIPPSLLHLSGRFLHFTRMM